MKFICEEFEGEGGCGEVDHILVNGYGFGDRILEDVYFKVLLSDTGEYIVVEAEGQEAYTHQLNMKHWLEEAHEYVKQHDFGECPQCRADVSLAIEDCAK